MITNIYTTEQLKEIFAEMLLNKTNKVTKVTSGSVLNGIAYGNAKLAQKAFKEVAILESHVLPESAHGMYLDNIARLGGLGQRFGARQSSCYIRVVGSTGTTYIPGINTFVSTTGVVFDVERLYTIGDAGYGYIKVRSQQAGETANVPALTINRINNQPVGHQYCVNEYAAQWGADVEEDDVFLKRIKEGVDILSKDTLSMYEQVFMKINNDVLRVFYNGRDDSNKPVLSVLTVNGIDLTDSELNDLLIRAEKYTSISDMRSTDGTAAINLVLKNVDWQPVDISFRGVYESSYNIDDIRKDIQMRIQRYLDYRYWSQGQKLEWDTLLDIAKNTDGVRYIDDNFFYPRVDIVTDAKKLPRIRGFQMLDINGNIVQDIQGNLNPIYYPNEVDFSFAASVLKNI